MLSHSGFMFYVRGVARDSKFLIENFGLGTSSSLFLIRKRGLCCSTPYGKCAGTFRAPHNIKNPFWDFLYGAGQGSRTLHHSLENCYFTDKLAPHIYLYSQGNIPSVISLSIISRRLYFFSLYSLLFACAASLQKTYLLSTHGLPGFVEKTFPELCSATLLSMLFVLPI